MIQGPVTFPPGLTWLHRWDDRLGLPSDAGWLGGGNGRPTEANWNFCMAEILKKTKQLDDFFVYI